MILGFVLRKTVLRPTCLSANVTSVRHTLDVNLYVTFQVELRSRIHRRLATLCTRPNLSLFLDHRVDHRLVGYRGIKWLSWSHRLVFLQIFVVLGLVLD